jgi:cytochrome c553
MKIKYFLLFLVVIFISCKNSNKENYLLSENINIQDLNDSHPGKKLLETNCYVCHNPTTDHDSRIAPPMIAVKKHYISETTTKQEFISDMQEWIKNPTEEKARMFGAVRKFGVMPKTPYPEETIQQIADYIYDYDIDQPEWFEAHFNEEKGKGKGMGYGKGNGNGQGKGRMMMKSQVKRDESQKRDKSNRSYSDLGLHYALSTKQELGKNLMGTIQKKGTLAALNFCNEKALSITDSMSNKFKATIKRVSDKPRNQNNLASSLEQEYIAIFKNEVKEGKETQPITVEHGDNIKFYYPIVTNSMCLQCHGNIEDQIKKDTFKTIKALYPEDKAIGYDVNNVRGIWSITFNKNNE